MLKPVTVTRKTLAKRIPPLAHPETRLTRRVLLMGEKYLFGSKESDPTPTGLNQNPAFLAPKP
jgi:hypothetical protein